MTKIAKSVLALAPLALLAACSGDEPAPPPSDNGVEMLDVTNEAANVVEAPLVMNTPVPLNDSIAEETPAPVPDQERIQADAEATGMTARVNRDEEEAPAATNASTAEERK